MRASSTKMHPQVRFLARKLLVAKNAFFLGDIPCFEGFIQHSPDKCNGATKSDNSQSMIHILKMITTAHALSRHILFSSFFSDVCNCLSIFWRFFTEFCFFGVFNYVAIFFTFCLCFGSFVDISVPFITRCFKKST